MERDFEAIIRRVYQAVLKPGDVAVDIGAHVGDHTLPMARAVAPGGRVIAFEPVTPVRKEMKRRIAREPFYVSESVKVHDCAIGEHDEKRYFCLAVDALHNSGLRERIYDRPTRVERIKVRVRRLDALLEGIERLDYIKADAEGGEYHAFLGARGLIRRCRPLASFEFGADSIKEYGITSGDMARLWAELDYRLFDVNGRLLESEAMFVESAGRQEVWDYIAVPREDGARERRVRSVLG